MRRAGWLLLLAGCDPYARWPEPHEVFPWVYTPEEDLPPYADVRVETETWTPLVDLEETALYVQKSFEHRPSAPIETLLHFAQVRAQLRPPIATDPWVSFVGDVMWLGGNEATFADAVADRLDGLRVGNLETPTSPHHPVDREDVVAEYGLYAFNSPTTLLDGLPLDVVQLNNNHALDLGDPGLEQTVKQVRGRGFADLGVDHNQVIAEGSGVRLAFLSYTWGLNVHDPSAHELFVVPFGHLDEAVDLSSVADDVDRARRLGATHVVLLLHWGYEYEYYPDPHFLRLGHRLIGLGADLVVGSGPHVVQPAEWCAVNQPLATPGVGQCAIRTPDGRPRDAAVLYSLGDFATTLTGLPLQVGIVATASFGDRGVSGLSWEAVASVPADGPGVAVVPLDSLTDDEAYATEEARLDALLGTRWKRTR